jgi:hypothetical protein
MLLARQANRILLKAGRMETRRMTRREIVHSAALATAAPTAKATLIVPVHRVMDARAICTPEQLRRFWWSIWPEAVRDFNRCKNKFQTSDAKGEIRRTAADRPVFIGLERRVLNLVLTDHIPMYWDNGRALAGVTKLYEGYHLCVIALSYAHANQVPFLSVNTCVHEFLHALMLDIFARRPTWLHTGEEEFRIDSYATRLWLFHDGAAIRESAQAYVDRLRLSAGSRSLPTSVG